MLMDTFEDIAGRFDPKEGNIISLLQDIQEAFGYIPREAIDHFSEKFSIPSSRFYGVVTFYSQFRLVPTGKNRITACCGTACHVRGAERIINGLVRELELHEGEDTTKDAEFTLEKVACLGTCSFAPVVLINGSVRGKTNVDVLTREIKALRKR